MVADRCSVLGNGRVFVKKMLKYVPGMWLTILSVFVLVGIDFRFFNFFSFFSTVVGWAWNFSDVAFLERNLEKDEETMTKNIQSLGDYPDPVWLLIFAEGTRLNPEKLEASRDFARKRGYPVLRHCKVFFIWFDN